MGRVEAEVFTERFFMLRIFLLGESARVSPERVGNGVDACSPDCMLSCANNEPVLEDLMEEPGSIDTGDSGEELGEGSLSAESRVDTVVVGDDSTDSKVEVESRRNSWDEMLEF